jgi:hypothetical protein
LLQALTRTPSCVVLKPKSACRARPPGATDLVRTHPSIVCNDGVKIATGVSSTTHNKAIMLCLRVRKSLLLGFSS